MTMASLGQGGGGATHSKPLINTEDPMPIGLEHRGDRVRGPFSQGDDATPGGGVCKWRSFGRLISATAATAHPAIETQRIRRHPGTSVRYPRPSKIQLQRVPKAGIRPSAITAGAKAEPIRFHDKATPRKRGYLPASEASAAKSIPMASAGTATTELATKNSETMAGKA